MISASNLQNYTPGGRQTYHRHPGSVHDQQACEDLQHEESIHQKSCQVKKSDKLVKEFWTIRENEKFGEEELYCSGKIAVHSKGTQFTKVLQKCYTCDTDIKHALWCKFSTTIPEQLNKKNKKYCSDDDDSEKTVECICLLDSYTMNVYTEKGDDYVTSLHFQVSSVWPTKYGMLLEKSQVQNPMSRYSSFETSKSTAASKEISLPLAFSLTHPLNEIRPLIIKHGNVSYMCESSQKIVFTSLEPSIAVIYDGKTRLHSVYKIRKATLGERNKVCSNLDSSVSLNNKSPSASPFYHSGNESEKKSSSTKIHLSMFGIPNPQSSEFGIGLGIPNSPFSSRGASYTTSYSGGVPSPSQQHQTPRLRSQSPMAAISRYQSPTNPSFSPHRGSIGPTIHQTRLHQTTKMYQSQHNQSSCNSSHIEDASTTESKPLFPEICLDHVWTENSGVTKDVLSGKASKLLLASDLVGQRYLGYLVPCRSQFSLVRIENTNKQQIIFGTVTNIVAKDAVNLPSLSMIAILDLSNSVILYSGASYVGKVNISSFLPYIGNFNYFSNNLSQKLSFSPFPRQSSLFSQNISSYDVQFDEALHTLIPVNDPPGRPAKMDNYVEDSGESLIGFKDAVGNNITLEYSKKTFYRVSLPTSSSSPLVTKCLKALKSVLQRDLAMELLVKWYSSRNAPGTHDFSSEQEWNLFMEVLFTLMGYEVDKLSLIRQNDEDHYTIGCKPTVIPEKQKTSDSGSQEDWLYVLGSMEHKSSYGTISNSLNLTKDLSTNINENSVMSQENSNIGKISSQAILFPYLPLVLFSLHLLYEELKLDCVMSTSLPLLAQLLHQLSTDLNFHMYTRHYFLDFPNHCLPSKWPSQICINDLQKITTPNYIPTKPPSVFEMLNKLLNLAEVEPYPHLSHVNPRTKCIVQLTALLSNECQVSYLEMDQFVKMIVPTGSRVDYDETEFVKFNQDITKKIKDTHPERIILLYHEMGMTKKDLEIFPPGVSLLLKNVMHRCRESPPSNWPVQAYELVDRQDLAALERHSSLLKTDIQNSSNYSSSDTELDDGMTVDDAILKLRFNKDQRVSELRRLLNSSIPVRITIVQKPEVSDHEFIEEQERHLHALCSRTMALPVARGMYTLRTSTPIVTEQLPMPRLCLTGKAALRETIVDFSHIDVPPNMNLWPLFHNGVAAGLRIHPNTLNIDSTWIVYNKQQGEFGVEHSGFLMALGLNGHLKNLAPFSMYEYLVECHEATNVGLLLGLSATYRGTMDVTMTKLLSLHVDTLLPPTNIELNVQQNVKVAALMGLGLVYEGTAHQHISHALLSEIGQPPGPAMKNCVDRESHSLAAGLALGLVILGKGNRSDLASIPDTLHYYMIGGDVIPSAGVQKEKYKFPNHLIREGDSINIDVTSPGATIALGFMYFNTGNQAVAEWMKAPETQYLLDFVRPDFLLLRILARSLILWNEIEPTKTWVSSHVPEIVDKYRLQKPNSEIMESVDLETMNQAYCNIIAGACMALGVKYAGSANEHAFKTLLNYTQMFAALSRKMIGELAGKWTIETCLNVTLLSAAVVMSGTGNLDIMRICRQIRTRVGPASSVVTYGSHLATHMALGFLFLGGGRYTLSNNPSAVAALIISLFPKFPTHSNDNRYHLQALRHLYVLAVQPRLILPRDIDTKINCYASIKLTFKNEKLSNGQDIVLKAPCLLPELESLEKVELMDDRYWKILFDRGHNWNLLEGMLSKCDSLNVKQRAGCLSYLEDPRGFRSLVAQTLTTENVNPWAGRQENIISFTNDKTVLNIVKNFLQNRRNEVTVDLRDSYHSKTNFGNISKNLYDKIEKYESFDYSSSEKMEIEESSLPMKNIQKLTNIHNDVREVSNEEKYFSQTLATIIYECVIKDKVSLLPLWVNLYKSVEMIDKRPTSYLIWQIKLIASHMSNINLVNKRTALLSVESVLAIKQRVAFIVDSWENELKDVVKKYLTTGFVDAELNVLKKFTSYCTYYDIPHFQDIANVNPFENKQLRLSDITLYKLQSATHPIKLE